MDIWSPAKRSSVMARIRSRDTKPELIVRSLLHRSGLRFSLRRKDLAGKPDIVLPKYRAVIFVHGCFWHRHKGCKYAAIPKSRRAFWRAKFESNVNRDRRILCRLRKAGWKTLVLWECEVMRDPFSVLDRILKKLSVAGQKCRYDKLLEKRVILKVAEDRLRLGLRQFRI